MISFLTMFPLSSTEVWKILFGRSESSSRLTCTARPGTFDRGNGLRLVLSELRCSSLVEDDSCSFHEKQRINMKIGE